MARKPSLCHQNCSHWHHYYYYYCCVLGTYSVSGSLQKHLTYNVHLLILPAMEWGECYAKSTGRGNRGPQKISDLPEVTRRVKGGTGVWCQSLCSSPLLPGSSENADLRGVSQRGPQGHSDGVNGSVLKLKKLRPRDVLPLLGLQWGVMRTSQ